MQCSTFAYLKSSSPRELVAIFALPCHMLLELWRWVKIKGRGTVLWCKQEARETLRCKAFWKSESTKEHGLFSHCKVWVRSEHGQENWKWKTWWEIPPAARQWLVKRACHCWHVTVGMSQRYFCPEIKEQRWWNPAEGRYEAFQESEGTPLNPRRGKEAKEVPAKDDERVLFTIQWCHIDRGWQKLFSVQAQSNARNDGFNSRDKENTPPRVR